MTRRFLLLSALAFAGAPACGSTDDGGGSVAGERDFEFATGEFRFTTTIVDDACLDGGLNLLFMPSGPGTPWDWPHPVRLYDPDELPQTYAVPLREPFGEMMMTATAVSKTEERARGVQSTGVLINEARFGDCKADMDADVQIFITGPDSVEGIGALLMTRARGERCPEMPDPCGVALTIEARRTTGG